ncbi:hypothetical protein [Paenibacillus xylanexedens]|uniref:hypothetical protein n=1 Tax=Paenibacillus xylanexedens TaxID=528191 RepID=UPI0011A1A6EB|nr:hypothetical protein [Paenibacillus xylanexedens]
MNEPKTPNLGLNKIDRSSPSTTYFDLDKYLDQNWEKIDEGVGQVEEKAEETAAQVSSIQERLDTEKRRSVTLEPGLQIINAERVSAFKLEGLKGRTLVNLLGRDGNFGVANNWSEFAGTKAVANNVITVTGNGSDINPQVSNNKFISSLTPKVGDKLFLRVRATPVVGTVQQLQLYLYSPVLSRVTAKNISNPLNGTTYDMYGSITLTQVIVDGWNSNLGLKLAATYATVAASNGSQVQYSQAAIYKISEADKLLTDDQVAAKYPYVDSVQPVRNPYAIRYGENLLPPFYDWDQIGTDAVITAPYQLNVNTLNSGGSYTIVRVPCLPNTTYRVKADLITGPPVVIAVEALDEAGNNISTKYFADGPLTTEANALSLRVSIYRVDAGLLEVKNPSLTIGNESRSFKPRKDSMLALQTDLYADPLNGENAEEVFEKNGQYFKMKKWEKLIFGENLSMVYGTSVTGYKKLILTLSKSGIGGLNNSGYMTKYDGKNLKISASTTDIDTFYLNSNGVSLTVAISSADSGWGDSYTPTADEIKAYFMGWVMFNGAVAGNSPDSPQNNKYNGSGAKWWVRREDGLSRSWSDATNLLPKTQALNWTPYQLIYQLATPFVEPITSEGQLTLFEGTNQIEVGTSIVLRERSMPQVSDYGTYINSAFPGFEKTKLKYRTSKILTLFKDGKFDPSWVRNTLDAYGAERAVLSAYNPSADYKVTYLMLDTFPIAAFVGSVPDNEKALLTNLVHDVQQGATSLSVVERSLSEALKGLQNKRNVWGSIE